MSKLKILLLRSITTRGSGMSMKKLVQTQLSFSANTGSSEKTTPTGLKRKFSETSEAEKKKLRIDMSKQSYANVARSGSGTSGSSGVGAGRGNFSSDTRDENRIHKTTTHPHQSHSRAENSSYLNRPSTSNDSKTAGTEHSERSSSSSNPGEDTPSHQSYDHSSNKEGSQYTKTEFDPSKLPQPKPGKAHKIFYVVESVNMKSPPKPYPEHLNDLGGVGKRCVDMPYTSKNQRYAGASSFDRWRLIENVLSKKIPGSFELEDAILAYNEHQRRTWNFATLHTYFDQMDENERDTFFEETLPKLTTLALQLPYICTKPLPILEQYNNKKISITQHQAACLLANAFFCTFPFRNFKVKGNKLPDINFSNLYSDGRSYRKIEKLKCIFNYFKRVTDKMPLGTLTYTRQHLLERNIPNWRDNKSKFSMLKVFDQGTIEDQGENMLQADFANKYVGGGALGNGLVQEEIRFMICPEMILARLFTECLTENEVLIMTGCERFSNYTGYSDTFKFSGNCNDTTKRDSWGRRCTEVVAMDALVIRNFKDQFKYQQLTRELKKAYCAFSGKYKCDEFLVNSLRLPPVCTGNWGCGAFGGDKQLKAMIQMMAASVAERDVCYYTFGDAELSEDLENIYELLIQQKISVKTAFEMIKDYEYSIPNKLSLFDYIFENCGVKRSKSKQMERQTSYKDKESWD